MRKVLFLAISLLFGLAAFAQDAFNYPDNLEMPPVALLSQAKAAGSLGMPLFLSINYMPGIRMGMYKDSIKSGTNILVDADLFINDRITVGIETGFVHFATDPVNAGEGSNNYIPLCARATYRFYGDPIEPYAGLTAGYYLGTMEYSYQSPPFFDPETGETVPGKMVDVSYKPNAFGVGPVGGINYHLTEQYAAHLGVQANFLFPEGGTLTYFGIRFGFVYKLGI